MAIHRCKLHGYAHLYTVCPACGCEYCEKTWPHCPRQSWHPSHGTTPEDIGKRYQAAQKAVPADQLTDEQRVQFATNPAVMQHGPRIILRDNGAPLLDAQGQPSAHGSTTAATPPQPTAEYREQLRKHIAAIDGRRPQDGHSDRGFAVCLHPDCVLVRRPMPDNDVERDG